MTMPGRTYTNASLEYRYGFQNQEIDKELWDGAVSYKYRIEDPRLGRFFSVDPLAPEYPWYTPYQFSGNRLIDAVELEGLEEKRVGKLDGSESAIDNFSGNINFNQTKIVSIPEFTFDIDYQDALQFRIDNNLGTETMSSMDAAYISLQAKMYRELQKKIRSVSNLSGASYDESFADNDRIGINVQEVAFQAQAQAIWGGSPIDVAIRYFDGQDVSWFEIGGAVLQMAPVGKFIPVPKKGLSLFVGKATKVGATGAQYSVAFETKLASNLYPGKGYYTHFKAANTTLSNAMASDAAFANSMSKLGISIPRSSSGSILAKSPANWVWHHDVGAGVMQLVPKAQHSRGSMFWNTMHPGGRGGMSIWGR